jgi:hypothetical protein
MSVSPRTLYLLSEPTIVRFPGVQAGAIFVNQSAGEYFRVLFSSIGLEAEEVETLVNEALESFEGEGKRAFASASQDDTSLKAGGFRFTEKSINVRRGVLTVRRSVQLLICYVS